MAMTGILAIPITKALGAGYWACCTVFQEPELLLFPGLHVPGKLFQSLRVPLTGKRRDCKVIFLSPHILNLGPAESTEDLDHIILPVFTILSNINCTISAGLSPNGI